MGRPAAMAESGRASLVGRASGYGRTSCTESMGGPVGAMWDAPRLLWGGFWCTLLGPWAAGFGGEGGTPEKIRRACPNMLVPACALSKECDNDRGGDRVPEATEMRFPPCC